MEEKKLYIVSGTTKNNAYKGEDSDLIWTGRPAEIPESVIFEAIDGLEDDYAEVQPLEMLMHLLRAGEEPVIAQDELNRQDAAIVEFQWREI